MSAIRKRKSTNLAGNFVTDPSRRHELAVAAKFGVRPFEAIPSACRPKQAKLSCNLLAKLADLALRTTNLKEFQRLLLRAWKRRPTDRSPARKDQSLQLRDVVIALHHLEKREATEVVSPSHSPRNLRRASVAKAHHLVNSSPDVLDINDLPVARADLRRTSKSAAEVKINEWASTIPRPRKASYSATGVTDSESTASMVENSEDEAPTMRSVKRVKTTASPKPSSASFPTPDVSPRLPITRALRRTRTNSLKSAKQSDPAVLSPSETPPFNPSSLPVIRRPRRGKSYDLDTQVSRQQEHAFFFKMPEGQHYKKLVPTMIDDVTSITDFNTLSYPVEVRGNKRGEFYEIMNAQEMRNLVRERKQRTSSMSTPRTTEPSLSPSRSTSPSRASTPDVPNVPNVPKQQEPLRAPTPFVQPLTKPKVLSTSILPSPEPSPVAMETPTPLPPSAPSPAPSAMDVDVPVPDGSPAPIYKSLLHSGVKDFSKTLFSVNKALLRSTTGLSLSSPEQAHVSTLMVDFLSDIDNARRNYEAGLRQSGFFQNVESPDQNPKQVQAQKIDVQSSQPGPSGVYRHSRQNSSTSGFKAPYGLAILSE